MSKVEIEELCKQVNDLRTEVRYLSELQIMTLNKKWLDLSEFTSKGRIESLELFFEEFKEIYTKYEGLIFSGGSLYWFYAYCKALEGEPSPEYLDSILVTLEMDKRYTKHSLATALEISTEKAAALVFFIRCTKKAIFTTDYSFYRFGSTLPEATENDNV